MLQCARYRVHGLLINEIKLLEIENVKAGDPISVILLPAHPASFAHNFVSGMHSF